MHSTTDTPNALTDLGKAFVVFLKWLVGLVVDTAAKHAKGNEGPTFIDARTAETVGLSRKTYLRLARQGAFPTHKAGKTILAKRVDVCAYIEAQNGAKARAPRAPFDASPVDVNELSPAEFYGAPTSKGK